MSWLRIDDGFSENPKVDELSDRAFRLHVTALCYCARNLTDGHVSARTLKSLLARTSSSRRHVAELEDAVLWLPAVGGGHMMKDYLDYNPPADEVKATRKQNAERQARWRDTHRGADGRFESNASDNALRNALHNAAPALPGLSQRLKTSTAAEESTVKPRVRVTSHDTPASIDFAARAALDQANRMNA